MRAPGRFSISDRPGNPSPPGDRPPAANPPSHGLFLITRQPWPSPLSVLPGLFHTSGGVHTRSQYYYHHTHCVVSLPEAPVLSQIYARNRAWLSRSSLHPSIQKHRSGRCIHSNLKTAAQFRSGVAFGFECSSPSPPTACLNTPWLETSQQRHFRGQGRGALASREPSVRVCAPQTAWMRSPKSTHMAQPCRS